MMNKLNPFRPFVTLLLVWVVLFFIAHLFFLLYFGGKHHLALSPVTVTLMMSLLGSVFSSLRWKKKQLQIDLSVSRIFTSESKEISSLFIFTVSMILFQVLVALFLATTYFRYISELLDIALQRIDKP